MYDIQDDSIWSMVFREVAINVYRHHIGGAAEKRTKRKRKEFWKGSSRPSYTLTALETSSVSHKT